MRSNRVTVALLVASMALTSVRAAQRADAVLLVNSASARYGDAQQLIRPYLDNFGVPYIVLDIATTAVPPEIKDYSVIIIGHSRLDTGSVFLSAGEQQNISEAVRLGSGLVNFDNDLSANGVMPRYQFIQDIFGFGYVSAPSVSGVSFPQNAGSHYVTSLHAGGEVITTESMSSAGITLPGTAHALANTTSPVRPFLVSAAYQSGRAIQWTTYDWMSLDVKGPMYGLDDLVWRSIVWAARKPFAMQGLPNILTMRVDDTVGSFWYVHTANQFGLKPWLGLFYQSISNADAADLSSLVHSGNATASVHAESDDHWFYWDHYGLQDWPAATMNSKFDAATTWHTVHDIPISKYVLGHYYETGTNVFARLQAWGVEFIGVHQSPGEGFDGGSRWVQEKPYRLYEPPSYANRALPVYYADFLTVPGHPEFQNTFFNCVTEIRDDAGYEWYPDNDVAGTIGRGTRQVKRAFDSMALGTLFTHEQYILAITPSNFSQELQGIMANLAPYAPRLMTTDDACRYVRAVYTSTMASSVYDPVTRNLSTSFTGSADVVTQFYAFTERNGTIEGSFVDVPPFTGSAQVSHQIAGPLDHIVVTTPSAPGVPTGGSRQLSAQGYDANNTVLPGLVFTWQATAGGTINQNGLFTAGATPGVFTNSVSASSGGVTGYGSMQVYAPVLDHFGFDPITGTPFADSPIAIRITAYDQGAQVFAGYTGTALLTDTTGTIAPTSTGSFTSGVWAGNVTLGISATGATITATSGGKSGTSNAFDVQPSQGQSIAFSCADDAHQTPVLGTTTNPDNLNATDGQWTEFYYADCRNYASVFAAIDEESFGLSVLNFYTVGIPNGQYRVFGKVYTGASGRDMRYFYGFQPSAPKAFYVDTVGGSGDCEQHTEYELATVDVTNGRFDLYVRDADLLPSATNSYPYFGWAAIRLACSPQTWYRDADGDGYGNASMNGQACTAPAGYVSNAGDCNDGNPAIHPGAPDTNCNGIDENCSGQADEGYVPVATSCGVGACAATGATSCVAGAVADSCVAGTSTPEVCDGLDNDCNGVVDNGVIGTWYRDADGDGYGDGALTAQACTPPVGFVASAGDCNDADPAVRPGAVDTSCNGIDENCSGQADEGYVPVATSCGIGACAATGVTSCVAGAVQDSCAAGTPTPEVCDGIDNDCNGAIDNGAGSIWYPDADGDAYGVPSPTIVVCAQPAGYAATAGDCDDANPAVHPGTDDTNCNDVDENCSGQADEGFVAVATSCGVGACSTAGVTSCVSGAVQDSCAAGTPTPEVCDGIDNDCNGAIDNGAGATWYRDVDGDAYGASSPSAVACAQPVGYAATAGDCDDANPAVHPGANDTNCNDVDENCGGQADEGYVPVATSCGVGACASAGLTSCVSGAVQDSCAAGTPTPEICDGIDNDCNGAVDNGAGPTWYQDADGDAYGVSSPSVVACAQPSGYAATAGDCNDANPAVHPGADDSNCNDVDEDCSGQADDGYVPVATSCGVGACASAGLTSCVSGAVQDSCAAGTPTPEICDGIDNDCNGVVDNGAGPTWYRDADGDGFGNAAATIPACTAPTGYVDDAADCDDTSAAVHPGAADTACDGIDDNCDGQFDEGYVSVPSSCGVGACAATGMTSCVAGVVQSSCVAGTPTPELCDAIDNDCDGAVDNGAGPTWYRDADGDGYGDVAVTIPACTAPTGYLANAGDCNDANPVVYPGAADTACDGIDDNCDGQSDEGYVSVSSSCGVGACAATGMTSCVAGVVESSCVAGTPTPELCDAIDNDCDGAVDNGAGPTWYRDADGDGYGDVAVTIPACTAPTGYLANAGDCNDANPAVYPGAADTACDGIDDNCDGQSDEGYVSVSSSCGVGACAATGMTSCVAGVVQSSCVAGTPTPELCDAIDNDCDGAVDNGAGPTWYRDADGDGYGDVAVTIPACTAPTGYLANAGDCNDANPAVYPGAADTACDGIDDNCDGQSDEGYVSVSSSCGVGACAATGMTSCVAGVVQSSCVAGTPTPELCDAIDNDCDGAVDNGAGPTWYRDADGDGHGAADTTVQACAAPVGYVATVGDCNDSDSGAFGFPSEVTSVTLELGIGGTHLSWSEQAAIAGPGTRYDLVTGLASELGTDQGYARAACLDAGISTGAYDDTRADSPSPTPIVTYYQIRAKNSCGLGTFGVSSPSPDPRVALAAASPCP